jgi:quinol monooxygenase YgiN
MRDFHHPRVKPFSRVQEDELLFYQIKIVIKQFKTDEFVESMRSFAGRIRKEKGCFGYSVYRDFEKENTYSLVGEWKTRQAMEKHFKTQDFEVMIGAARVLGETFEMNIAEVLGSTTTRKAGGLDFSAKSGKKTGAR